MIFTDQPLYVGPDGNTVSVDSNSIDKRVGAGRDADNAYDNLRVWMNDNGLEGVSVKDYVEQLHELGYIDNATYNKYSNVYKNLDDYEKQYGEDATGWQNFWGTHGHTKKTSEDAVDLFNDIRSDYGAKYERDKKGFTIDRFRDAISSGIPNIPGAPAPTYLDVNPDNVINPLLDVDPVKMWSNAELAELHDLAYDPNYYYDLVKQSTSAALDAAVYNAQLMSEASRINDSSEMASYLDSVRNNRAEAIANGATQGAQAASELLAMNQKNRDYITKQAETAANRFNAIDNFILEDAGAKLKARSIYESLANNLMGISNGLYTNDSDRFGQEWLSNAERYTADQNVLANRIYANNKMAGDYAAAQGTIDAARMNAARQNNDLLFMLDRYYDANKQDLDATLAGFNNYISGQYTGYPTSYEYDKNKYSK